MDAIRTCLSSCWPFTSRAARYERMSSLELNDTAHMSDDQELIITQDGKQITLTLVDAGVRVVVHAGSARSTSSEDVPFLHVLFAGVSFTPTGRSILDFSYLSSSTKGPFLLRQISTDVSSVPGSAILKWVSEIQRQAYRDISPRRRFLAVINPHGGQGLAKKLWEETIEPIFNAAGCILTVRYTGPASSPDNATNIARTLDLTAYDALVSVSGDGIVNELINGLANRPDAATALRTPIAPIPAGSGNALCVNIMGPGKVLDVAYGALNAIKGRPLPLDVCSVTQGDTRIYSFLSQAVGIMADLDMGTEWMRWVGGIRFVLGYLYGIITKKTYEVEITLKVVESDKRVMVDDYNMDQQSSVRSPEPKDAPGSPSMPMPPLAFGTTDAPMPLGTIHDKLEAPLAPGWHTFRTRVQSAVAGKMPWLARDSMIFPLAKNDGLIDVVMAPPMSVMESFKSMEGQEEGRFIRLPVSYYYKVEAYRCTPLERTGYISVDGESIPHRTFQVENHARLARILSLETRWKGLDHISL
ncbi:ATP-NAD kinase-like domain-containing protein [Roridomyces roridus]|uniref:ATP-NAD kinase-like domain-containing protein n=1 Tax=Roridomyces roridus TaxID=1738132 RepID=A0AAD7BUA2_9AGAR|nr:ATP-NAD kinase-like domain-containing protein [Roridomyces roridus]